MKVSNWAVVALVALVAVGFGVREFRDAGVAAEARAASVRRSEVARASYAALEKQRVSATKRAEAVESDNATLEAALKQAEVARANPVAAPVSRELFAERLKKALALGKDGDGAEALRELLWCFDTAEARPAVLVGVQKFSIVNALATLGERQPAALGELRARFEKAKRRVLGAANDTEPLSAMGMIARALKDDQAMVAVFDAIPAGDVRRSKAAIYAVDGLIAAKRYREVLGPRPWVSMSSTFEANAGLGSSTAVAGVSEAGQERLLNHAVTSAAKNIEVLAGAGDLVHARELAGRVLALDGSEATRALVQKHLERAGQAGLLRDAGK